MANTYTELFYHFIWSTKGREPAITPEVEAAVHGYIRVRCQEMKVMVHALNGTEDHTHLVVTLPPDLSIADFLEKIKGASSHFINRLPDRVERFYWQEGYGALTFAKRDLPRIVAYVQNQKQHHRDGTLSAKMERGSDDAP